MDSLQEYPTPRSNPGQHMSIDQFAAAHLTKWPAGNSLGASPPQLLGTLQDPSDPHQGCQPVQVPER